MLPLVRRDDDDHTSSGTSRATVQLVRRLINVIATRDSAAIWSMFANDGIVEFPFVNLRFTDMASFDAVIGPSLAALDGLTFTDVSFVALADPNAVIAKYRGHATVSFTGKPYEQSYVTEAHVRHGKITSYSEYYDTAVLNEAFTP
jgi:ketosteroid isomerase-like protein